MVAHVLIPVKRLGAAKSRLADAMSAGERAELMRGLLDHVLRAVREADVGPITVVSGDKLSLAGVPRFDDRELPWNDALAAAMREVVTEPVATVVAADLPLVSGADVRALVAATPERGLAIARARDGGTNGISMRPPAAFATCFGSPSSADGHARIAESADGVSRLLDLPGLAFDVDTPEDLAEWQALVP